MKTVTIRMDEELAAQLEKEGDSLNRTIVNNLKRLYRIRAVSTLELQGIFTHNEWKFLFDAFKDVTIDDALAINEGILVCHSTMDDQLNGTAARWQVDIDDLNQKLGCLNGANVESLLDRVRRFWNENGDLEEWSNF